MKLFTQSLATFGLALTLVCMGCGPSEDAQTEVEVTTTTEGGGDTTIIHDTTTVIVHPPDTVVKRDTIVRREIDTVVKRDTVALPVVSAAERALIDAWLRRNVATLNEFGDPIKTVYTGDSPLISGKKDRYQYIVGRHASRPWMEPQPAESRPRESRPRR